MIYIIGLITHENDPNGKILRYSLMETLTESCMSVTENQLKNILSNCNKQVANATLLNDKIHLADWVNKITLKLSETNGEEEISSYSAGQSINDSRCSYTLMTKVGDKFKLASYNGSLWTASYGTLEAFVKDHDIANCSITEIDGKAKINGINTYETITDKEFETEIYIKYKVYEAKMAMLGHSNSSFDYKIENKQVVIEKFTGSSKDIILPSFITGITKNAFATVAIETLSLNEGLQFIGNRAFTQDNKSKRCPLIKRPIN